jgi:hypothetical protein
MADEVLDLEVARNKMKEWREEPPRNSEEVIELGESLIVEHGSKLGDECMFFGGYKPSCTFVICCYCMKDF